MVRRAQSSQLFQRRWHHPAAGAVSVIRPSRRSLEEIDAHWDPLRDAHDVAKGWEWALVADDPDVFMIRAEQWMSPLALWRSTRPSISLGGDIWYRLDNVEVHPGSRLRGVGRLAIMLVISRALELGSNGVILAAPDVRVGWYKAMGAAEAWDLGWKHPRGLTPLKLMGQPVVDILGRLDVLEIDEDPKAS